MSRSGLRVDRCEPGLVRIVREGDAPDGRGHLSFRTLSRGTESARVALVAEGALLLAGDDVQLSMTVGPGVSLEIVEPAGTVAFDMRGGSARWVVDVTVAAGAELTWYAEPFVIATGADVRRDVRVSLAGDAVYRARETLVWGRVGEVGGRLEQSTYVADDEGPLLSETLVADGAQPQVGVLEGSRVMDTLSYFGTDAPQAEHGAVRYDLERNGTVLRSLLTHAHESPLVNPAARPPAAGPALADPAWTHATGSPAQDRPRLSAALAAPAPPR